MKHRFRVAASSTALVRKEMSFPDDIQRLDAACRIIASGRSMARQLGAAVGVHHFSETEFRLLWLLRERSERSHDASTEQATLPALLGISPAQVSAIVEKLRARQIMSPVTDEQDRRRKLWELTPSGRERFESILATIGVLSRSWVFPEMSDFAARSRCEDAA